MDSHIYAASLPMIFTAYIAASALLGHLAEALLARHAQRPPLAERPLP